MYFEQKKSLGQNFLNSDYIPKKMCDAAGLFEIGGGEGGSFGAAQTPNNQPVTTKLSNTTNRPIVLEIGPGTGALTKELLARGAQVTAVEADARAVTTLKEIFSTEISSGQLSIIHADARTLDFSALGLKNQTFSIVANIPYYLSGLLFRTCLESNIQPHTLVFLVQKEVALRIARDEKESLLSLSVKAFGEPTYICTVKRGHFTPAPKVDSAIIAINNINQESFTTFTPEQFFTILHLGFGQKRKQLLGNLSSKVSRQTLTDIFTQLDIPLQTRAEDLSLPKWLTLTEKLLSTTKFTENP